MCFGFSEDSHFMPGVKVKVRVRHWVRIFWQYVQMLSHVASEGVSCTEVGVLCCKVGLSCQLMQIDPSPYF